MQWIAVVQVMAAAGMGAVIGLERELDAQRAGLRTHMLVALGSTLFTVAGADVFHADPARIAAQVVTGIGFLGGGAILREGATVRGLTTAAALWVTAAIGVAIGLGSWVPAAGATALSLIVLRLVKRAESMISLHRPTVVVTAELTADVCPARVEDEIESLLPGSRMVRVTRSATGSSMHLLVRPRPDDTLTTLSDRLLAINGMHGVEVAR